MIKRDRITQVKQETKQGDQCWLWWNALTP